MGAAPMPAAGTKLELQIPGLVEVQCIGTNPEGSPCVMMLIYPDAPGTTTVGLSTIHCGRDIPHHGTERAVMTFDGVTNVQECWTPLGVVPNTTPSNMVFYSENFCLDEQPDNVESEPLEG